MTLRVRLLFSFPHYQVLAVAIILSLLGLSEIVLSVLGFVQKIWGYGTCGGIWGGATAFAAGLSGIVAANKKAVNNVRIFLISSILSCIVSVPLMILSAGGLSFNSRFYRDILPYMEVGYSSTKLVHGFLLGLAVAQFAISLVTTIVCLKHLYWNEWVIKRQHAQHIRQVNSENTKNKRRSNRLSTSSSAPLVTSNSGQSSSRRHRKHKRRKRPNNDNCSDCRNDERRHHQRPTRESPVFDQDFRTATPATDLGLTDASRIPEVSSNLMSVNSVPFESSNVRTIPYDYIAIEAGIEYNRFQPPLPIEDDDELPPYEETVDESVMPMSISNNASESTSSVISSSDEEEIQAWDSVSQTQKLSPIRTVHSRVNQETTVKYCAATSVQSKSSSLPLKSNVLIGILPEKALCQHPTNNQKMNRKSNDLQGVSYHEFTRESDQILGNEKKAQRTQSFLRERAMAKESSRSASRKSSVQENAEGKMEDIATSPLDSPEILSPHLNFLPQTCMYHHPQLPRQSVAEIRAPPIQGFSHKKDVNLCQNPSDSNDSTSSLSKDILFIKEGPPIGYALSSEQILPETVISPFSEVSWQLLKDFPNKEPWSETCIPNRVKPKLRIDNRRGTVPVGIKNRVVKTEVLQPNLPVDHNRTAPSTKPLVSKECSVCVVSDPSKSSINKLDQPTRLSCPPKLSSIPTKQRIKNPKDLSDSPSTGLGGTDKVKGQTFCLTAASMAQFSPKQTSTLKKDVRASLSAGSSRRCDAACVYDPLNKTASPSESSTYTYPTASFRNTSGSLKKNDSSVGTPRTNAYKDTVSQARRGGNKRTEGQCLTSDPDEPAGAAAPIPPARPSVDPETSSESTTIEDNTFAPAIYDARSNNEDASSAVNVEASVHANNIQQIPTQQSSTRAKPMYSLLL